MDPRLVDATGAAIARWGLTGATLNRIADEADMSRATFYRRGVTRDQLVAALTDHAIETFRAALWPALTGTGTAVNRLRAALDAMCATLDEHPYLLAGIFLTQGETLDRCGRETLKIEIFTEPLERLLRDGAADGTLREVQPTITAAALFNTVGCGYIRLRAAHDWDAETARQSLLDLVMSGLKGRTDAADTG
jgi:AcrR family transcriptional regulator